MHMLVLQKGQSQGEGERGGRRGDRVRWREGEEERGCKRGRCREMGREGERESGEKERKEEGRKLSERKQQTHARSFGSKLRQAHKTHKLLSRCLPLSLSPSPSLVKSKGGSTGHTASSHLASRQFG